MKVRTILSLKDCFLTGLILMYDPACCGVWRLTSVFVFQQGEYEFGTPTIGAGLQDVSSFCGTQRRQPASSRTPDTTPSIRGNKVRQDAKSFIEINFVFNLSCVVFQN